MFYLFVEQDGIYDTVSLLITDEYTVNEVLRRNWYMVFKNHTLYDVILHAYNIYWKREYDFNGPLIMNLEDSYKIDLEVLVDCYPEWFI